MTQNRFTRREALQTGAGIVAGAAATLAGRTRVWAQAAAVNPTPPPARDLRYPLPPTWNRELRQLAPNVYAYTQGGGPDMSGPGVSNAGLIVGPDYMLAIDALQGPIPAKDFIARAAKAGGGKPIARLLNTHHHGIAVCAVYDRHEDAVAKIETARNLVREHGHPLELRVACGDAALGPMAPIAKAMTVNWLRKLDRRIWTALWEGTGIGAK